MAEPDVIQALVDLGFNLNEGRAYAALLLLGASTGYEVSQRTDVPRSAVYGALRRLVGAGAARSIAGNPERFVATPPDGLLTVLRKRFESSADSLNQAAERLATTPTVPDAFSVRGYERVLEEAGRLVHSAERTLVASGWPRELEQLAGELREAHERGVTIVLFSHSKLPTTLAGIHFGYGIDAQSDLEEFWKHRLVMVADDRRCLIGAAEQRPDDTGVVSETTAIAEVAVGQIALDITLLAQRHGHDITAIMAEMLGHRVGRLDNLLASSPTPELGQEHTGRD